MIDITGWLIGIFGNDNYGSLILVLFIVMFLDAFLIPTIPEIFFITVLGYDPGNPTWIATLLCVSIIAEASGIVMLWYVAKHFRIPHSVKKAVSTYVDYMIVPNEKMVFVNRFAPMLPFTGAFSAIMNWNIKKVLCYNALGCVIKYGLFAIIGGSLYVILGPDAGLYVIVFTLIVLAIGISLGIRRKKKRKYELERISVDEMIKAEKEKFDNITKAAENKEF